MRKAGITLSSMVLYVVLFFIFATFAIAMSSNMNYKTLSEKGRVWNNEQAAKIEYNLLKSAKASTRVDIINEKIVFSNNDEYEYDAKTKRILKNGGVVAMDVELFSIIDTARLNNVPLNMLYYPDHDMENIAVEIKFKKYGQEKIAQYFMTLGDDNVE